MKNRAVPGTYWLMPWHKHRVITKVETKTSRGYRICRNVLWEDRDAWLGWSGHPGAVNLKCTELEQYGQYLGTDLDKIKSTIQILIGNFYTYEECRTHQNRLRPTSFIMKVKNLFTI